ncbi:hypothetical protein BH18ACI3_BH18ACI3_06950 [soil metagenome]
MEKLSSCQALQVASGKSELDALYFLSIFGEFIFNTASINSVEE